jgi:hypothetical protein
VNTKNQDQLQVTLYPSVPATLILDETDDNASSPSIPEASYASAHILLDKTNSDENEDDDDDEAVLESRAHTANLATDDTTTWITALALDPWDKEPTVSSTLGDSRMTDSDDFTMLLLSSLLTASAQLSAHPSEFSLPQPEAVATIVLNPSERYTATDGAGESLLVKKMRRRRRRRVRMILAGVTGFVAGAAVLGPLGAYMGAAGGAALAHGVSKRGERRKDRRVAKRAVQRQLEMMQQQQPSENDPDPSSTPQQEQHEQQQPPQPTMPQSGPLPQATVH